MTRKSTSRFFRNLAASVGSKQAKRSDPREENKVEFLETQFYGEKLSFAHKKESEHFFELFLSICVFHRRIFKLKTRNLGLENHHMMNARQPFFCWRMPSTKVPNPLLSHPLCGWPFDFSWGGAYGWFSLGKNVFPKPLELEIFSQAYNGVRFVSALCTSCAIFFPVQIIIFPGLSLQAFPPQNQLLSR